MFRRTRRRVARRLAWFRCRLLGGSLRGPIGRFSDRQIDADLARLGLDRDRLFHPDTVTTGGGWR